MLADGHALYTPGLRENRGGSSAYYANDQLGNLWTLDGTSKSQLTYEDNSGFGGLVAGGSGGTPFGFGGGNGCQTDVDLGLVLMGHRYYDPRTGRFLSQDPAGAGGNWYAYAYNNPVNRADPLGLDAPLGDFGLGEDQRYAADPISSARAGLTAQMNQSSGLIAEFQYYSVDKVTYNIHTGQIIGTPEHLFDFAVPVGTSILGNFSAAENYANTNHASAGVKSFGGIYGAGLAIRDKIGDAKYVNSHFKHRTVGDFKDKNFPGIGQPRLGTRLYDLADNGGNMNGGMSMEGLGMSSQEIGLSGDAHKSMMDQHIEGDDPMGAAVLQVGYNYGLENQR